MSPRFQADADRNEDLVTGVMRPEPAIDFRTARAANLRGVPDPQVLAFAATEGRILVTHDRKTMPRYFAEFVSRQTSPGVLIVSQSTHLGRVM